MNPVDLIAIILTVPGAVESILTIIQHMKERGRGKVHKIETDNSNDLPMILTKPENEKVSEKITNTSR